MFQNLAHALELFQNFLFVDEIFLVNVEIFLELFQNFLFINEIFLVRYDFFLEGVGICIAHALSVVFRKADNERARKFVTKRNFNENLILTTKANAPNLKFVVLKT